MSKGESILESGGLGMQESDVMQLDVMRPTHVDSTARTTTHVPSSEPVFHATRLTFLSVNVVTLCRLAISSNRGCRHVPDAGVVTIEAA